jgi:valyl-tRNA synthetase
MALPKSFAEEMAAGYDPIAVEDKWYSWWENSGFFQPSTTATNGTPFVVILPPPNVTGYLHLGHALTGAVQDTIVRFQRMNGRQVLYLPGTDHAGIATQVVVEKRLQKEEGKSRHDLGRDAFLKRVWEFKEKHANVIQRQLRMIGSSLDWSRERFTMDEQCAKAVTEAFVRLYDDKKLYRATRLVNWCCALQSAISDLEVEFDEVPKEAKLRVPGFDKAVQMGQLTRVAYKVVGTDDELEFATTRPETMLGDSALAVHPDDERYKKYHGKTVWHPFRNVEIPIICDKILVDMTFGTGVVKVTPAHDPNDFEAGQRHNLEQVSVLDLKGHIALEGPYYGMHRFECRAAVVKFLEESKMLRGVDPHEYRVGKCSRTGDIVEPMLLPQWFVDTSDMAARALDAVRTKQLILTPESHETTWNHFLSNAKPWCISRQLWWGHRIPAYLVQLAGKNIDPQDSWVVARSLDEARTRAQKRWNLDDAATAALSFEQDPDVLDTWFSSGLWPFSTMGWPDDKSPDMERFFPNSLLETGHDILFFWVARMVMMSLHLTGKLPFKEVFLHAMVRDKDGQKMSKSKGNVIDPLDVISGITLDQLHETVRQGNLAQVEVERALKYQKKAFPEGIPQCGSDALRFGLLTYTQSGKSVNLDIDRIVGYRQFCNKLWNVTRYVLYYAAKDFKPTLAVDDLPRDSLPLDCRWILSRLDQAVEDARRGLSEGTYDFALATNAAYRFWLYDLCDVFLELTKAVKQEESETKTLTQNVLIHVVEKGLRLLHPMLPFVTEELWHRLPHCDTFAVPSIMIAEYPKPAGWRSERVEHEMKLVMETVHTLRSVKAEYQLTNKTKPDVWVVSTDNVPLLQSQTLAIATLAVVGNVIVAHKAEESNTIPEGCGFSTVTPDIGVHMMLKGMINVDGEVKKIDKKADLLKKSLKSLEDKMNAPSYTDKVPEAVRDQNTQKAVALRLELSQLTDAIARLQKMK